MVWNSEPHANLASSHAANPPLSPPEPLSAHSDAEGGVRGSISRILSRSFQPADPWNNAQFPSDNTRSNRMSWISDAPSAFETVTTNNEPGWNFSASSRDFNLGFPMPTNDSSRQLETNYVNNEIRSTNASRPSIHIVPPSFESSTSSLNPMPSPQTDFSHLSSSFFVRRNYSPVMISDSDESMGIRTRWPSPGPSPSSLLPMESSNQNGHSWWTPEWNYIEENRVPPPPAHSPPAPPHAAAMHQSNFSMPPNPNVQDNSVTGRRSRSNSYRPRPPSLGWDFLDVPPATPSDYRPYSFGMHSPTSPSDVSVNGAGLRDFSSAPFSGHRMNEPSTGFDNGPMRHQHQHSASDSDSTMDLHRLLNRHTGLNSMDRFQEMTMPRSHEHPFVPSYPTQNSPTHENSGGSRRVRFPDDIHQAPPSSRVVSPPPPNRRLSSFPFHALFDRHSRRNEAEVSGYTASSASHHTRSASDGAQGDTQFSGQPNPNPHPHARYPERPESWRDSLYPSAIPRRPVVPLLFSRISDSDSRESTPRPAGAGARPRDNTVIGSNSAHMHNYFHDELLSTLPDHPQDRERRELNSFLGRRPRPLLPPPPAAPNSTTSWSRERTTYGAPPGLRADSPVPSAAASTRPVHRLSLSGLSGPTIRNRSPSPTGSSPTMVSPVSPSSPIHNLPFFTAFRPGPPPVEPTPSNNRRGQHRRSVPRPDVSFSWLDDPLSPPVFNFEDEAFPITPPSTRSRAGRASRVARQPSRMLPMGRMHALGDYVVSNVFDDNAVKKN